ncbi:CocE/NonD family hydrolase [Glaciibacter superstes]|uniref:CocE/NonD family hydrolase n=1 Tax=Glaciibacter superstes TaxID=501023 RepID=UPI0003B53AAF|nr:CocE/NonD family hydrolase [Glaciibacter superstes]
MTKATDQLGSQAATDVVTRTSEEAGMRIDRDVPIVMDDSLVIYADVYRPIRDGRYPVIITYGPYAKGLAWQDGYPGPWQNMIEFFPDALEGSSNLYQSWEVVDPEKWVPDDYVCVRVDSRGSGMSPGVLDCFSKRETQDYYAAIEWAGTQPWSNGKVGLNGISYYAINQWQVAALKPPHLYAICPWEGSVDFYRDGSYHGGIPSTFWGGWFEKQCSAVQHGLGSRGYENRAAGGWASGNTELDEEALVANRADLGRQIADHPFAGAFYDERSGLPAEIDVPVLTSGNWGGQGLHLRGNTMAWELLPEGNRWLEMHGGPHWAEFYTDYGVKLQKRFFDRFLKDESNNWDAQPPVSLLVRHVDGTFTARAEKSWPIPDTQWAPQYFDAQAMSLTDEVPAAAASVTYRAQQSSLLFSKEIEEELELTGPMVAKLFVSSSTTEADLFVTVRLLDPQGEEVVFFGALDPHTPIAQGWLRASQLALDPARSVPHRPFHMHDKADPLVPGEVYELDIEILPTSIVIPAGYRLMVEVAGADYVYPGEATTQTMIAVTMTGCGPFIHPGRDAAEYNGEVTLHTGGEHASHLVVPRIPRR